MLNPTETALRRWQLGRLLSAEDVILCVESYQREGYEVFRYEGHPLFGLIPHAKADALEIRVRKFVDGQLTYRVFLAEPEAAEKLTAWFTAC